MELSKARFPGRFIGIAAPSMEELRNRIRNRQTKKDNLANHGDERSRPIGSGARHTLEPLTGVAHKVIPFGDSFTLLDLNKEIPEESPLSMSSRRNSIPQDVQFWMDRTKEGPNALPNGNEFANMFTDSQVPFETVIQNNDLSSSYLKFKSAVMKEFWTYYNAQVLYERMELEAAEPTVNWKPSAENRTSFLV
jgi:hypothetical protein